jgi:hypothetical protein
MLSVLDIGCCALCRLVAHMQSKGNDYNDYMPA